MLDMHFLNLRRMGGQAMVEYVVILPCLLFFILGALQLSLIYQAKNTLNYATFLAARQGALHNGKLCVGALCSSGGMTLGLAYGLAPLYTRSTQMADKSTYAQAVSQALLDINLDLPVNGNVITTTNPTTAWVNQAKRDDPYKVLTVKSVPNDNLLYRTERYSNISIQDGNILKIKTKYCFKMEIPFANRIIYTLNNSIGVFSLGGSSPTSGWTDMLGYIVPTDTCKVLNGLKGSSSGWYLPLVSTAAIRMQTPYIGP